MENIRRIRESAALEPLSHRFIWRLMRGHLALLSLARWVARRNDVVSQTCPVDGSADFRAITSLTPIQYQKQLRLHAARTRLMTAREDVAEVGFAAGDDSPSQFSREYRRLFGTPPGMDGAQMKANAATAAESAPA